MKTPPASDTMPGIDRGAGAGCDSVGGVDGGSKPASLLTALHARRPARPTARTASGRRSLSDPRHGLPRRNEAIPPADGARRELLERSRRSKRATRSRVLSKRPPASSTHAMSGIAASSETDRSNPRREELVVEWTWEFGRQGSRSTRRVYGWHPSHCRPVLQTVRSAIACRRRRARAIRRATSASRSDRPVEACKVDDR